MDDWITIRKIRQATISISMPGKRKLNHYRELNETWEAFLLTLLNFWLDKHAEEQQAA